MSDNPKGAGMNDVNMQELQHLITVSTGFIDAYIIQCHDKPPMLLPQNIVLSALDSPTAVATIEWHKQTLAVFNVSAPNAHTGVALVIEGEKNQQRFALMCKEMPDAIRIRISELVDEQSIMVDHSIMQYVYIGKVRYHVPNLDYIQNQLDLNG